MSYQTMTQDGSFAAQYDQAFKAGDDAARAGILRSVLLAAKTQFGRAVGQYEGFDYDGTLDHPAVTRYEVDGDHVGARTLYDGAIIAHDGGGAARIYATRIGITGMSGQDMAASKVAAHFFVANSPKEEALRGFVERQDAGVNAMRLRRAA